MSDIELHNYQQILLRYNRYCKSIEELRHEVCLDPHDEIARINTLNDFIERRKRLKKKLDCECSKLQITIFDLIN